MRNRLLTIDDFDDDYCYVIKTVCMSESAKYQKCIKTFYKDCSKELEDEKECRKTDTIVKSRKCTGIKKY